MGLAEGLGEHDGTAGLGGCKHGDGVLGALLGRQERHEVAVVAHHRRQPVAPGGAHQVLAGVFDEGDRLAHGLDRAVRVLQEPAQARLVVEEGGQQRPVLEGAREGGGSFVLAHGLGIQVLALGQLAGAPQVRGLAIAIATLAVQGQRPSDGSPRLGVAALVGVDARFVTPDLGLRFAIAGRDVAPARVAHQREGLGGLALGQRAPRAGALHARSPGHVVGCLEQVQGLDVLGLGASMVAGRLREVAQASQHAGLAGAIAERALRLQRLLRGRARAVALAAGLMDLGEAAEQERHEGLGAVDPGYRQRRLEPRERLAVRPQAKATVATPWSRSATTLCWSGRAAARPRR